jgi:hypothetical protein
VAVAGALFDLDNDCYSHSNRKEVTNSKDKTITKVNHERRKNEISNYNQFKGFCIYASASSEQAALRSIY